jgi:hypothetical protein
MSEKNKTPVQTGVPPISKLNAMLHLLCEAVFDHSDDCHKIRERFEKTKDANVDDLLAIRHAVADLMYQEFDKNQFRPINKKLNDLDNSVEKLSHQFEHFFSDHSEDILKKLMPHGEFLSWLRNDHPEDKKAVAEYAVETFFSSQQLRCFVQASTTAVAFAQVLAGGKHESKVDGSLFYTNSVVFPCTALSRICQYTVYSFCGRIFDPQCCGWLFGPDDTETANNFRVLFKRPDAPLTTVFLTPTVISAASGPLFKRPETAFLARLSFECAQHVVIMTPAYRVTDANPQSSRDFPALKSGWDSAGACRKSLVFFGRPLNGNAKQLAQAFVAKGVEVHWFDTGENQWKIEK